MDLIKDGNYVPTLFVIVTATDPMQLSARSTSTAPLLFLVTLCLSPVSVQRHVSPRLANDTESICRPFGECEPCPHEVLREPFCQPFGNRRLLHCLPPPPLPPGPDSAHPDTSSNHNPDNLARPAVVNYPLGSHALDSDSQHRHEDAELLQGETIAWESCGRIVVQERADFWEFVACNLIFICIALVLVFVRSKRMNAAHARQLAARIGLSRGYG
ncbi:hypothetical protein B0F90DRAFT_1177174 [Multifurca ochricompacta]|uniref:Uncharacterized protein n=1 Tax=Multifurca ochricompacta TaxID=376703 RepID=A0AAD4QQI5_9AGAM|nr:hypothetical protein B0F90DRAFT_1177174 [Multifurca ochricompacta]